MSARIYLFLTLAFYGVGAVHVVLQAMIRRRLLTSWTAMATLVGFALHTAGLSQRWTEVGHFPAVGWHDGASFLAWFIVLAFLAVYVRTRLDALGLAVHPVAFVLVLVANLTAPASPSPMVDTVFLPVHATLAFAGYGALFVAFAMGVLYLIQERELKAHRPQVFYYLAPSLERCDTIGGTSAMVGFVLLTLAIVTGVLWNHSAHARYVTGDAKEWSAIIAWGIYVALILARQRSGWGGRRAALLGIAGFVVVAFTFAWTALEAGARAAVR
jgi:ABC-type uncharacterized transport system permease subunit